MGGFSWKNLEKKAFNLKTPQQIRFSSFLTYNNFLNQVKNLNLCSGFLIIICLINFFESSLSNLSEQRNPILTNFSTPSSQRNDSCSLHRKRWISKNLYKQPLRSTYKISLSSAFNLCSSRLFSCKLCFLTLYRFLLPCNRWRSVDYCQFRQFRPAWN